MLEASLLVSLNELQKCAPFAMGMDSRHRAARGVMVVGDFALPAILPAKVASEADHSEPGVVRQDTPHCYTPDLVFSQANFEDFLTVNGIVRIVDSLSTRSIVDSDMGRCP